jgi:hypothetical protein
MPNRSSLSGDGASSPHRRTTGGSRAHIRVDLPPITGSTEALRLEGHRREQMGEPLLSGRVSVWSPNTFMIGLSSILARPAGQPAADHPRRS